MATPPAKCEKTWAKLVALKMGMKFDYSPTPEWWSGFLLKVVEHYNNEFPLSLLDMPIGRVPDSWGVVDNLIWWLYGQTHLPRHRRDFRDYVNGTYGCDQPTEKILERNERVLATCTRLGIEPPTFPWVRVS